jgi:hypothetical protein
MSYARMAGLAGPVEVRVGSLPVTPVPGSPRTVRLDDLVPWPGLNVRESPGPLEELVDSVRAQGVLQSLLFSWNCCVSTEKLRNVAVPELRWLYLPSRSWAPILPARIRGQLYDARSPPPNLALALTSTAQPRGDRQGSVLGSSPHSAAGKVHPLTGTSFG